MDNSLHLGFGEYLILVWGLFVFFWMARAPKALLTLFGLRDETGRAALVGCVRWFGRFNFFSLLSGILIGGAPTRLSQNPVYGVMAFDSFSSDLSLVSKTATTRIPAVGWYLIGIPEVGVH